jgi:hypothetical protein
MLRHAKARFVVAAGATMEALNTVLAKSKDAKALYGNSVGYAAFNNVKVAVNVSGGGGDGVAFFQLTDKGLMASADVAGTKYWKNDDLIQ